MAAQQVPRLGFKTVAGRTEFHISAPTRKRAIQEIRRLIKGRSVAR